MPLTASRGFAIGLFACVYAVAKWSDSAEIRYIAMVFSIILLIATMAMKWWNKNKHKITADPLAIPGPKPTDATSGNLSQLAKCGSLHQYIKTLSRVYGPIGAFYWGSQRIAYISSQSVLSDSDNKALLRNLDTKPLFMYSFLMPLIGKNSIHFAESNIYHTKIKKVFNKINNNTLISIENEWNNKLNDNINIDIERDLFSFATKCVIHSIFGVPSKDYDNALITQIMDNYNKCLEEMEQRLVHGLPPNNHRKKEFEECIKSLKHGIIKMMDTTASNKNSLINCFKDNNEIYPNEECVLDEIITILNGIHKMYYGLLWIMYFVAKHSDVQSKMMNEIASVFDGNDDDEYMDKLMKLKYCKRVILESLRITSVVSWTARVCNDADIVLNVSRNKKVKITAKMPIIIGLGAMNTEKKEWRDPYTFKPDRYKDDDEGVYNKVFGGLGNRGCPGQKLFEAKALLFIVKVLVKFELKLTKENDIDAIRPRYGLLTKPHKSIAFDISKRQIAML